MQLFIDPSGALSIEPCKRTGPYPHEEDDAPLEPNGQISVVPKTLYCIDLFPISKATIWCI